jgi:hypothetical protein
MIFTTHSLTLVRGTEITENGLLFLTARFAQEREDRKELQRHFFLALLANKNSLFFERFACFEP